MIVWMQPLALWGLLAAAGAVVVHVLFRARAVRVAFPSLRFVHASPITALRLRQPSDLLLLAVRIAILAMAALALAQPLIVTAGRMAAWNGRIVRAIVVDASADMRDAATAVEAAIAGESGTALISVRFDTRDLSRGMQQAVEWLETAPPARREVVVISNFRRGAIVPRDVERLSRATGLRLVRVGTLPPRREFTDVPRFDSETVAESRVLLDGGATSVAVERSAVAARGLDIVAPPASGDDVHRLRRVVAAAGAPAPDPSEPIVITLGNAQIDATLRPITSDWMLRTALAIQQNGDLAALGEVVESTASPGPWLALLNGRDGKPLVRVASAGERLVVDVPSAPSELLAAAAVRAALLGRRPVTTHADNEVLAVGQEELATWARGAPPVAPDGWTHAGSSDARWCWALVLLLLGVETVLRRRRPRTIETVANAA